MFDSAIIDIALGLAFVFLLVSLLVTTLTEGLSSMLRARSVHLWDGLEHLLQSAGARNALYAHPLIKGLARVSPQAPDWKNGKNGPSYIPSRTFALALIDIIRRPHEVVNRFERQIVATIDDTTRDPFAALRSVETLIDSASAGAAPAVERTLDQLKRIVAQPIDANVIADLKTRVAAQLERLPETDRANAKSIADWLTTPADAARTPLDLHASLTEAMGRLALTGAGSSTEQLRGALVTLLRDVIQPEAVIRQLRANLANVTKRWLENAGDSMQSTVGALSPLAHEAADDVDRFRENIEIWFNDGMDRVAGWYKRYISRYQKYIAFALAVILNVDALQITRTLWREPTLRKALAAEAEAAAGNAPADLTSPPLETAGGKDKAFTANLDVARVLPDGIVSVLVKMSPAAADSKTLTATATMADGTAAPVQLAPRGQDFTAAAINVELAKVKDSEGEGFHFEGEFLVKAQAVKEPVEVSITIADGQSSDASTVRPRILVVPADRFTVLQQQLGSLGLPIGWSCPTATSTGASDPNIVVGGAWFCSIPPGNSGRRWTSASWLGWTGGKNNSFNVTVIRDRLAMLLMMLFGWGITGAAASLGAPFWFDSLKRIISIRSSGKAPEEKPLSPKEVPQPREPGQRPREADFVNALRK